MTDEITLEIFNHLVELAALELDAAQAEYLHRQLNNQLKAIHELEAIPLDPSTPIALHGVSYSAAVSPGMRLDESKDSPDREDILSQVPQLADRYIVVPETPHITLE